MKITKKNVATEKLHAFENHPYKVKDDEEMQELAESIRDYGMLSPIIVRPKEETEDEYEIISGHRRLFAAKKIGMETVPVLIYPVDRDKAAIMMVDSNLHREDILPSEKAFAYRMKMEALNRQGMRTDLTSDQVGPRLTVEEIAENDSASQVKRYIRLTHLISELLEMVDEGKIAFTPAVELSYLTEQEQYNLLEIIECEDCTPSLSQAQKLRKLSKEEPLTTDDVLAVLSEKKGNQVEMVRIPIDRIFEHLHRDMSQKDLVEIICKALDHYEKHLNRQREER